VKADQLENSLPLFKAKGGFTLRNFVPVSLIVLMLATNSFAAPAVVQSSVIPEPGLLALLGGGLVGLATLIRRHLSD
jgi:PEP-CTERM motif